MGLRRLMTIFAGYEQTPKRERVAAYARVSTIQDAQEESYESQVSYYKAKIAENPCWDMVGVFGDEGVSGLRMMERPQFLRLYDKCKKGEVDRILCKSISRFARNAAECIEVLDEMNRFGVVVYFEKENIYSNDKNLAIVLKILASLAQEEVNSISQLVKFAYQRNAEVGNPTGSCPYGYKKLPREPGSFKHVWVIDLEQAKRVRLAFDLARQEAPFTEIAKALNEFEKENGGTKVWRVSTVSGMIRNVAYKGDVLTNKTVVADYVTGKAVKNNGEYPQVYIEKHHQALVDPIIFDHIQAKINKKSNNVRRIVR